MWIKEDLPGATESARLLLGLIVILSSFFATDFVAPTSEQCSLLLEEGSASHAAGSLLVQLIERDAEAPLLGSASAKYVLLPCD